MSQSVEIDSDNDEDSRNPSDSVPLSPLSPSSTSSGTSAQSVLFTPKKMGKRYFHEFYNNRKETKEDKNGRSYIKRTGGCILCTKKARIVSALDSYRPFKEHLEKEHKSHEMFKAFVTKATDSVKPKGNTHSELTLDAVAPEIRKEKPYEKNHPKQLKLNEIVTNILVETLMSANALGHPLFDAAIKVGDPRLKWPHRLILTRRLVPAFERAIKEKMRELLCLASAVTINADIWTSKRMRAYIAFSVSFIDSENRLRNFLLGCYRFAGTHTAHDIFEIAVEVIAAYDLQEKIHFVGTDNGGNIVNAFKDWLPSFFPKEFASAQSISDEFLGNLEYSDADLLAGQISDELDADELDASNAIAEDVGKLLRDTYCRLENRSVTVRCVAHTLQLCIKDAMKKTAVVSSAADYLAGIVSRVKHSAVQTNSLEKALSTTLVSRNETRWNSTFLMCERAALIDWDNSGLPLDNRLKRAQIPVLQSFVKLMRVFEDAFKLLQTAEFPVIGAVIPVIYGLKEHLRAHKRHKDFDKMTDFIQKLIDEITGRFDLFESDELYLAATFLDPQYKLRWCRLAADPPKIEAKVRALIVRMMKEVPNMYSSNLDSSDQDFARPSFLSFLDNSTVASNSRVERDNDQWRKRKCIIICVRPGWGKIRCTSMLIKQTKNFVT